MIDFDLIIKSTLASVNVGFEKARDDLQRIVESVTQSIQKNTGRQFSINYTCPSEDVKGTVYRVYFDTDWTDEDSQTIYITSIWIPFSGYPIKQGLYRKAIDRFEEELVIANSEGLESYFAEILSDPESSLIQAIGFAMRREE